MESAISKFPESKSISKGEVERKSLLEGNFNHVDSFSLNIFFTDTNNQSEKV